MAWFDRIRKSTVRTLYVSRRVLNFEDIIRWAKSQGFKRIMPPSDLHVTLVYSKTPVDWSTIPDSTGPVRIPGGAFARDRKIEQFDGGAVVLRFESKELSDRWAELRALGAESSYPTYKPHVTITYEPGDIDLTKVQPYLGDLEFSYEIFEEVNDGWSDGLEEQVLKAAWR